jgi:hypothetical protein
MCDVTNPRHAPDATGAWQADDGELAELERQERERADNATLRSEEAAAEVF